MEQNILRIKLLKIKSVPMEYWTWIMGCVLKINLVAVFSMIWGKYFPFTYHFRSLVTYLSEKLIFDTIRLLKDANYNEQNLAAFYRWFVQVAVASLIDYV